MSSIVTINVVEGPIGIAATMMMAFMVHGCDPIDAVVTPLVIGV
jgi:hypothetical protein